MPIVVPMIKSQKRNKTEKPSSTLQIFNNRKWIYHIFPFYEIRIMVTTSPETNYRCVIARTIEL